MTTPVHADPRRSGAAGGLGFADAAGSSSGLDIPVLFQLSDLSQHKVLSPPQKPTPQPAATKSLADGVPSAVAAHDGSKPVDESTAPEVTPSPAAAINDLAAAGGHKPLLTAAASATEVSSPAAADSPTIRERAQLRERRRQATAQGDWFQTQGKYILVVFLVLLVGVIYVARRGGDDSPPPPTVDSADLATNSPVSADQDEPAHEGMPPTDGLGEIAPVENVVGARDFEPRASDLSDADHVAGTETSASDSYVAAPGEESPAVDSAPQVTLQAPVQDEPIERPTADGLFPWADQPEQRVATRPAEPPGSSALMPQANPHFQARPQAPQAVGASRQPADAPPNVYPSTGIEGVPYHQPSPTEGQAPAVYPVVDPPFDPAAGRSSSTQPRQSTDASGVAAASYENRVSTATRTSGLRHERTGSGLY